MAGTVWPTTASKKGPTTIREEANVRLVRLLNYFIIKKKTNSKVHQEEKDERKRLEEEQSNAVVVDPDRIIRLAGDSRVYINKVFGAVKICADETTGLDEDKDKKGTRILV